MESVSYILVYRILSAMYVMYWAPFNKRQDLRLARHPWSMALQSRRSHTLKSKYVSLLCCVCPLPRIPLPATTKSLEKCSWKLLLIYGTVFAQYPLKPHVLKYWSYEFSLKNIHDSYHFMSLLLFTLKGFVLGSCACVKWSACTHNCFLQIAHLSL